MFPSSSFRSVDQARNSREKDRDAWAHETDEIVVWETEGAGTVVTPPIPFRRLFEGQPAFSYGVERPDLSLDLVAGDYPFVSAGVAEWSIVQVNEEGRASFYRSATVWMTVSATTPYLLRWTFTFSGTVMRNREYIGAG